MNEVGVHMEFRECKEELEDSQLCQGFKWDPDEKKIKVQEEMLKVEEKSGEICGKRWNCKSGLLEKGAILGKMTCENETIAEENLEILEGVNTEFVKTLPSNDLITRDKDEATGHLVAIGNKPSEVDKKDHIYNFCCKDEVIAKLEADLRKVHAKLISKDVQFSHLEEAYEKLRSEFQSGKLQWEKERLIVQGKISSLQSSLDSQMRISESLQTKLKMCNQALTHEESRRKLIEFQLSESQALFENIYAKCIEEQAKIDQSNAKKDEEIASLRYLFATNDILFKDMEYKNLALKTQKEDMRKSLKGFQEDEIKYAASLQTLTKLQQNFEILEQVHDSCSTILERKEIEWTSQYERLKAEVQGNLSELNKKETEILDLRKELEMCQFSLQCSKEEMEFVVMLIKSEYSEAYAKLLDERENNQNQIRTQAKDLEDSKNMLKESQRKQRQLEEHVQEVENVYKAEMAEKARELNLINAELQKSKSDAEDLKSSLEEAQEILKQTEARLQLQLDTTQTFKLEIERLKSVAREHERNNEVLQQQVSSLESALEVKDETLKVLETKNSSYAGIIEELERKNVCLNEKISALVMDWQNILGEMEGASNQLHEICCQDEGLLAAFW